MGTYGELPTPGVEAGLIGGEPPVIDASDALACDTTYADDAVPRTDTEFAGVKPDPMGDNDTEVGTMP